MAKAPANVGMVPHLMEIAAVRQLQQDICSHTVTDRHFRTHPLVRSIRIGSLDVREASFGGCSMTTSDRSEDHAPSSPPNELMIDRTSRAGLNFRNVADHELHPQNRKSSKYADVLFGLHCVDGQGSSCSDQTSIEIASLSARLALLDMSPPQSP